MMECTRTDRIVQGWEEQGALSAADLAFVTEHLHTCRTCARKNAPLLSLIERDASVYLPAPAGPGLPDRVVTPPSPRRVFPAAGWAAIAAACLIMGTVIGFTAFRLQAPPITDEVLVRFELDAPGASSVVLVGSFSGWNTTRFPMRDPSRSGVWRVDVRLKRDSINTYNFVINGSQWIVDPRAQAQVDDGFGGKSSVLRL